jgi:hypothetical protein
MGLSVGRSPDASVHAALKRRQDLARPPQGASPGQPPAERRVLRGRGLSTIGHLDDVPYPHLHRVLDGQIAMLPGIAGFSALDVIAGHVEDNAIHQPQSDARRRSS